MVDEVTPHPVQIYFRCSGNRGSKRRAELANDRRTRQPQSRVKLPRSMIFAWCAWAARPVDCKPIWTFSDTGMAFVIAPHPAQNGRRRGRAVHETGADAFTGHPWRWSH